MTQTDADKIHQLWMSTEQACTELGCSRRTLYRRVEGGVVESKRRGKRTYFRVAGSLQKGVSSCVPPVPSVPSKCAIGTDEGVGGTRAMAQDPWHTSGSQGGFGGEASPEQKAVGLVERLAQSELERGRLLERYEGALDEAVRVKLLARRQEQHIGDLQELVDQQNKVILELSAMVSKLWPGFNP